MSGSASLKPDLSASAPTPLSRLGSQCGCRHFEPVGGNYAHHNLAMCRPFIICARSLGHRRSGMPDLEIVRSGNQSLDGGADDVVDAGARIADTRLLCSIRRTIRLRVCVQLSASLRHRQIQDRQIGWQV